MKISKIISSSILLILASVAIIIFSVIYFFFSNEAPVTKGEVEYGIPYKEGKTLDIYHPTQGLEGLNPVLVFIHGGGWIAGRKESINMNRFNGAIKQLRENGYTVISPEYTLAREGKSPFPDCLVDIIDALEWMEKNTETYQFDLANVGLFGESAGAHIAMMIAYGNFKELQLDPFLIDIKYVVDVYGPTDLESLYHAEMIDSVNVLLSKLPDRLGQQLDLPRRLLGFDPDEDSVKTNEFMRHYSPVTYVSQYSPPTLIIHGEDDILVPIQQSEDLFDLVNQTTGEIYFKRLPGVNHAFLGASKLQMDSVQNWIADFVLNY